MSSTVARSRALSPRVYPAGRAALLLGICGAELGGRKFSVEGRAVSALAYGRMALLVTFVDPAAFEPEALAAIRTDEQRFGLEARLLEQAVERASAHGAIVPSRALTVFADANALEVAAREAGARWMRTLARLRSKRECVVHVYGGPHVPPGGAPYIARVAARSSRSGKSPALRDRSPAAEHAAGLWQTCSELAISSRRVRSFPERGSLWTAAFLVDEAGAARLETHVERSTEIGASLGVAAHFEGPRLPFSFV